MNHPDSDAILDALAFTRCSLNGDWAGRDAVAQQCDPVQMVDALALLYIGLVGNVTGGEAGVDAYLAVLQGYYSDLLPGGEAS